MARYITAGEAVTRVLKSMSLSVPVSISGSTDSTTALLWHLLGQTTEKLVDKHEWQMLNRTYIFNTVVDQLEYPLPADFQNFIDETGWNNTSRIPLIGPLSSQQWRLLQARQLGGTTLRLQYIIKNDKLKFYFAPSAVQEIAIYYKGKGSYQDAADPAIFYDRPQVDTDLVLYTPRLIVAALQNQWRIEKGFDTTATQREMESALIDAKYNDKPKVTLSLNSRSKFPYLGYQNMPDTSYGS